MYKARVVFVCGEVKRFEYLSIHGAAALREHATAKKYSTFRGRPIKSFQLIDLFGYEVE